MSACTWLALGCCLGGASVVRAQSEGEEDPAVIATARELAISGVKLAQDGHCVEAVPKLERAEKLHHAPIVLTRLGDCYIQLGQLIAGLESLRAVLREPLPDKPSEALAQAYAEAGTLIEINKPKLAKLTIRVTGVDDTADVALTIDGKSLPSALLGAPHVSDPGEHRIELSAPGYLPAHHQVTLAPGGAESLVMALKPDPQAVKQSQLLPAQAPESATPEAAHAALTSPVDQPRPNHLPAYLTWGASAAALGVGIGFGFAALENKRTLEDRCPEKVCPPDQQELLDTSRMNAAISTIAYGVGIGGAALGALLFWLENQNDDTRTDSQATRAPRLHVNTRGVAVTF